MSLIKCHSCGRILAKGTYIFLEIKCPRCKTLNAMSVKNAQLDCLEQQLESRNDTPKVKD